MSIRLFDVEEDIRCGCGGGGVEQGWLSLVFKSFYSTCLQIDVNGRNCFNCLKIATVRTTCL